MSVYSHAYLTGCLFWLGVWGALFLLLKRQRREMLWTGLLLAPAGPISEFWSLQDYWQPEYVYEFRWGEWRLGGVEDGLLVFALAGICAGLFEFVRVRQGASRLPPVRGKALGSLARWPVFGLVCFVAGWLLGLRSIHTLFLATALAAAGMLWRRYELWAPVGLLALAFAFAYWLFYVGVFIPLFPGAIEAFWKMELTWGLRWGGVPVEELLWAGLTMLFAGPYLRVALISSSAPADSCANLTGDAGGG